ncbi:IBR domain containing protein [Acanthamoeba castellanii str. Neff]|uniref:RBR-type E3 ubiquitin transferase n=1 Tax=Acanthamoeba castellanii (strain ATCC 30010 / Neff) TaxID=1257118 RepID=L8H0J7_ACACF|nr:IBR domain containing protein [Acanthamoeba castellanii str. Neff]ELR17896.1 IBR domain containing protein [Acanthamoeba castellanii str. Neff]
MDGSDDDEFNGFEEGEEEEEDFDFGDGDGDDDNDDEPLPSLSMADDDAISSKGSMRAYKIIAFEDIISSQQTKAEKIHEVLGIANSFARILLVHYGWDEERLLSDFFERGIDYVYKSAGVVAPKENEDEEAGADKAPSDAGDDDLNPSAKCRKKEVACESCMDDVLEDNTTKLACGHRFCNDCYQTYVAMKINEGQANAITCMAYKCNTKLDETLIPKLVDDPLVLKKYHKTLAESYVNDNPLVKWCTSTPHCGNAVEVLWGKQVEVQCCCHHRFCFNCLKDPHSPVPCKMVNQWMEKCEGEGETFKYISANTKDCPKCGSPVEKNGGCNLMTCRCGTFFCWLCGAQTGSAHTWEKIAGHSCGKYKEEKEKNADDARVSLQRYMHYYERYKAHNDSSMLEAQMRVQLLDKVSVLLEKTGTFTSYEEKWLARALDMLFECRRVLKWSYVLAYFIFGPEGKKMVDQEANKAHKMLFEDHQEQLEITTEILSKKLETPPQEMTSDLHLDIMNITVLAERRCKGLFDIILSDIVAKGAYGFDVSGYSFSMELTIQQRLGTPKEDESAPDDKAKGKEKEKEKEKEREKEMENAEVKAAPAVGLNSPVAKIARKRDDNARDRLWEARRAHRGQAVAAVPQEVAVEPKKDKRKKKETKEEEEMLKKAMELSEEEMMRKAIEASEKEQLGMVTYETWLDGEMDVFVEKGKNEEDEEDEEDKDDDKTTTTTKIKTKTKRAAAANKKRKRTETKGQGEQPDAEQELLRQAIAASINEF